VYGVSGRFFIICYAAPNIMNQNDNDFSYSYSAEIQDEVDRIRQKYLPEQDDKMARLRKLDKQAEIPGLIISLLTGVVGTALLGIGLSGILIADENYFIPGIIVGSIGLAIVGCAYPLYTTITRKQRQKIADKILRLADELNQHNGKS
jgi:hypothetical protein